MPELNCAVFGNCTIFKVPAKEDEYSTEWRKNIIDVITRDRIIDRGLHRPTDHRTLFVCETHYLEC